MFPVFPKHDQVDCPPVHSKEFSYRSLGFTRFMSLSYFEYLIFFEFAEITSLSSNSNSWMPVFPPHVLHVFSSSSEKKMRRIAAWWIITLVTHIKGVVVISKRKSVCNRMSGSIFSFKVNPAILMTDASRKGPTIIWQSFIDSRPKPFFSCVLETLNVFFESCSTKCFKFCRVFLHNSVRLICATSPARQGAGAPSLWLVASRCQPS